MKIDSEIVFGDGKLAEEARRIEDDGYDGAWVAEIGHDPMTTLAVVSQATTNLELGTGILVAFARSPMVTATMANDIQILSRGRLLLGLGSQIKPHIEKRYSMPWSHPAPRMKEYVQALRAIWTCWQDDTPLRFRGEFYRHTLMTPFFSPGPNEFGPPKVLVAAVGALMTEVAGEVADGLLVHPFTTETYLREVTIPAVQRGLAASERTMDDFTISFSGLTATGLNDEHIESAIAKVRAQIAFYGSTPSYRGVLELHGWGELQSQLNELSREGRWDDMANLINDDVLDAFALVGTPSTVAARLRRRFDDVISRFGVYAPYELDATARRSVMEHLR